MDRKIRNNRSSIIKLALEIGKVKFSMFNREYTINTKISKAINKEIYAIIIDLLE